MDYNTKFQKGPNIPDIQIEMIHDGKAYITKLVPDRLKVRYQNFSKSSFKNLYFIFANPKIQNQESFVP